MKLYFKPNEVGGRICGENCQEVGERENESKTIPTHCYCYIDMYNTSQYTHTISNTNKIGESLTWAIPLCTGRLCLFAQSLKKKHATVVASYTKYEYKIDKLIHNNTSHPCCALKKIHLGTFTDCAIAFCDRCSILKTLSAISLCSYAT